MIKLTEGVRLLGMRPELLLAIVIAAELWGARGMDLIVTGVTDGERMQDSLYYAGAAVDISAPDSAAASLAEELDVALGVEYDVVVETTHIHVEYRPEHGA